MTDSFFIHPQHRKVVTTIYQPTTFNILHEDASPGLASAGHHQRSQPYNLSVEQMSTNDLLQIRLVDTNDQTRMLISTIDQPLFERIKTEQSLNVSFAGFVEHFMKILDATKRSELHLALITAPDCRQSLQFFERRSFRNLVHLLLPIEQPSERVVLHYIQHTLIAVQQQSTGYAHQAQQLQQEIGHRDNQIVDLKSEVKDLHAKLHEQENQAHLRNSEHVNRLQLDIQLMTEAKDVEVRKLNHTIKTLQDTVDYMTKEKYTATEKLNHEVKKFESVRDELKQLKAGSRSTQEENERLRQEVATNKNHERKTEHVMSEQRKQLTDLRDQVQALEKHCSELDAELEAEKHIARTKRMALELASDEITKANSIIVKQSKELGQLSTKVDWRTEVALQQEKRMNEVEAEVQQLRTRCQVAEESAKENGDVSGQLQRLREAADELNRKYTRKIQELKSQLHQVSADAKLIDCTNRNQPQSGRKFDSR